MEFPATSLFFFMLVPFQPHATIFNTVVYAQKHYCDFPAIFNMGDSNSDTGGYAAAFRLATFPYGDTYFHMPAGRISDGRLIIDFIGTL